MSYVVIEIDMNYDFIENVKIKKIFNSKEECEEYIKSREKEFYKSFELKNKYIDNFVKTIRLPDLNGNSYKIWEEFVSKFGLNPALVNIYNFYSSLAACFKTNNLTKIEGYNPPEVKLHGDFWVLELKEDE